MILFFFLFSFSFSKEISVFGDRYKSTVLNTGDTISAINKEDTMIFIIFSEDIRDNAKITVKSGTNTYTIDKLPKKTYGIVTKDNIDIEITKPSITIHAQIWTVPQSKCYASSYVVSNNVAIDLIVNSLEQRLDLCLFTPSIVKPRHIEYGFINGKGDIRYENNISVSNTVCQSDDCIQQPKGDFYIHFNSSSSTGFFYKRIIDGKETIYSDCQFSHIVPISSVKGVEKTYPLIGEDPKLKCYRPYYDFDFITNSSLFSIIVQVLIFFVSPILFVLSIAMLICGPCLPKPVLKQAIDNSIHPIDDEFQNCLIDELSDCVDE